MHRMKTAAPKAERAAPLLKAERVAPRAPKTAVPLVETDGGDGCEAEESYVEG